MISLQVIVIRVYYINLWLSGQANLRANKFNIGSADYLFFLSRNKTVD